MLISRYRITVTVIATALQVASYHVSVVVSTLADALRPTAVAIFPVIIDRETSLQR